MTTRQFALLTALALLASIVHAQVPGGRWMLDLSGSQWQMEGIRPGQGVHEGFFEFFDESAGSAFNWNGATVPGDVYTDLWRAGQIEDPHYGRNGMKAKWAMEQEWWYRRTFKVPDALEGQVVRLIFEGVDYSCSVWLNGQPLGSHTGMFSPFEFDVSSLLRYGDRKGDNGLVVRLDPPPRSYHNVAGRKFGWHGDYWRTLTPMGIWKPILLVATGAVQITDVYPRSQLHHDGSATVTLAITLAHQEPAPLRDARVRAVLQGATFDGPTYEVEGAVPVSSTNTTFRFVVRVPEAKLWWPWDLGEPNLYTVETTVLDASGTPLDQTRTRFGIREITYERNPGYAAEEVEHPWTIRINGRRTFQRSASWGGPPDIFYGRNSPEKYARLVQLAKDANINNLRIFGWHPTEVDRFYELCDELGMTVWQDLIPLASVKLPEDEAFRAATCQEAVAVIKTLRHHPSLVRLEGGEEMFYGTQGLEENAAFLRQLGSAIQPYTDLQYIPTSPLNWPPKIRGLGLGGPKESAHTHALFYGLGGRLLEEEVATWDYAVIPEFGVTSSPNVDSVRRFIPPDELWPPGPSWGYHWADLDVFRALNYQILGDERVGSLEDFVAATQIAQGTIFQYGLEHMRRRKPRSSGIAICHFITFSPDFKWGIVDYFQVPKRSFDFVRRAYQPLLVSLQFDRRRWLPGETFHGMLWVVNDRPQDFARCTLRVQIADPEDRVLLQTFHDIPAIAGDSSAAFAPLDWTVSDSSHPTFRVSITLQDAAGQVISTNYYDLMRGGQDLARRECAQRAEAFREIKRNHHPADYYRFYPGLSGPGAVDHFNDEPTPAAGYPR